MNLETNNHTRREGIVDPMIPMINVALLLLVYFLLLATIERQPPLDVNLPTSEGTPLVRDVAVYLDRDGVIAFEDLRDEDAVSQLSSLQKDALSYATIYADSEASAPLVIRLVNDLKAMDFARVELAVEGEDG